MDFLYYCKLFYIKEKNNNKNNRSVVKGENKMELIECLKVIKEANKDKEVLLGFINESLEFYKYNKGDFDRCHDESEYSFDVRKLENGYMIVYGQYFGVTTTIEVTGDVLNSEILSAALTTGEINDSHVVENKDLNVLIYNSTKHDGLVHKDYYFIKDSKLAKEDLDFDEMFMESFEFKANPNNVLRVHTNRYTPA